jgi:hypothetical protein
LFATLFACGIYTANISILYIHDWRLNTHTLLRKTFCDKKGSTLSKNIIGEPQQLSLRRVSFKMYSHAGLERARYILNRVEKETQGGGPAMKI